MIITVAGQFGTQMRIVVGGHAPGERLCPKRLVVNQVLG